MDITANISAELCGVIPIDKPKGFTSFDVVAKCRGILKTRKIGHSGTLDPMATGVLPVFIGKATRACDMLPDDKKAYTAGFRLGLKTDTQDITGKVIAESGKNPTAKEVEAALSEFEGETLQLPPMYSAVSVGGKRLYELARQGIEIERKPRPIFCFEAKLLSYDEQTREGRAYIACSKGTYIRTIINDLGEKLETFGCMSSLVRNFSGGFELSDCLSLEQLEQAAGSGCLPQIIRPVDRCFLAYPEIHLTQEQTRMYKNGVKLDLNRIKYTDSNTYNNLYRLYGADGEFLAVARTDRQKQELRAGKNFF